MSYQKTVFNEGGPPGISAAELNKIGDGLEAAAAAANSAVTDLSNATSAATPNTVVRRDAAGRYKAAPPAASDDVARKLEVDNVSAAALHAGVSNTSTSLLRALILPVDTRNWLATAWDGDDNPTTIQIRNGSTVVCTLTMTYEDGNLKTLIAADGTRTITWTLTWTAGRFVSFTKAVT